jgi:protein-disulfide isomerase
MALKNLLTEALNATPADNDRRKATLQAAIKAVDESPGASDADILGKLIAEREYKAATFTAAGQSDLAKAERVEVDALRALLRVTGPGEPQSKKAKPAAPSQKPDKVAAGPLFSRTQIVIAGVAVVLLAAAGLAYYLLSGSGNEDTAAAADNGKLTVPVLQDDHTMGNPKAPILIVEYAAPACPHCAHFNETEMPLLKQQYIDTGKVFYVFRVFPIMPADGAAEAIAVCLPKENYFQFIDLLFRNQKSWDPEYGVTDVRGGLLKMARIVGLDADKVDQCIGNKDEQDHINAVAQDAETRYNVQGTPTFVVDGQVLQIGDVQWPQLKPRLDSLLANKH